MDNKVNGNKRYNRADYVEGTAARKYAASPEKITRPAGPVEVRNRETNTRPVRKSTVRRLDFVTMLLVVAAICFTTYTCLGYLKLRSDMRQLTNEVIVLSDELTDINDKNEGIRVSIEKDIDFEYIYQVAVGELGMVYPNNNKVYSYTYNNDGYVRQYEEIPTEEKQQLLDSILWNK